MCLACTYVFSFHVFNLLYSLCRHYFNVSYYFNCISLSKKIMSSTQFNAKLLPCQLMMLTVVSL